MQCWMHQKLKGEIETMKNKTQKNKRNFIKPFKHLIDENGLNSLNYINKNVVVGLTNSGDIQKIPAPYNTWYKVNILQDVRIELLEVKPDYYKFVSGGTIGSFLRNYEWKYDGKNVYTCTAITSKKVIIERVLLNFCKYGYFKIADIDKAAHHMWFRFCALADMLISLPQSDHMAGHKKVGNYDRGQSLRIETVSDFRYVISEIAKAHEILLTKKFSLEF